MQKKKFLALISLILVLTMAFTGCTNGQDENKGTETQKETTTENTEVADEPESSETPAPSETPESSETPAPSETPESSETPAPSETPESSETPAPSETPESSEAPESSETPETPEEPVDAPIVKKNGTVDTALYNKAVNSFKSTVMKMRADGLVSSSDVCVEMDNTTLKVDITFDDSSKDITLVKNTSTNVYTLTIDYGFSWIPGFGDTIKGIDPALYNKELLKAVLGMVSNSPEIVFNRIDLDCFSAAGLDVDKWTEIADCAIMGGPMEVDKYISYYLTTEDVGERDASYTMQGNGVSCVIEYDSSIVKIEKVDGKNYLHVLDESLFGPYNYPEIKTGCGSFEEYKNKMKASLNEKGITDITLTEYNSHTVNGYTYYWFECNYKSETEIGDPDIVYVQIGENTYIELYNIMFQIRFEDFINQCFYIKEVK